MANYSKLNVTSMLFPSLIDEVAILAGVLVSVVFGSIYAFSLNYDVYQVGIQPYVLNPLNSLLLRYGLPGLPSHFSTFLVLAAIGLLVYFVFYLIMNNFILLRNETIYDNFTHPTAHYHHWGKFFSVEAAKLVLVFMLLVGTLLLIHPISTGLLRDLGVLFNEGSSNWLAPIKDVGLMILMLNSLLIAKRTKNHLHLES